MLFGERMGAAGFNGRNPQALRYWLLITAATLGLFLSPAAQAQETKAPDAPQDDPADVGKVIQFQIQPQNLDSALTKLADQAGIHILSTSQDMDGLRSPGVIGKYTVSEALDRLMQGTGLLWRLSGPNTVIVQSASSSNGAPVVLAPLQVEAKAGGDAQSPDGPGVGYVATRSTAGTKTDTPLIETPQAISVVTRQQMDDQNVQTVTDALRYSPGVVSAPLGTQNKDTFYVRGFGDTDGGGQQYLDGMKLIYSNGFAQPQIDTSGLERVEVLHGPASVLYGQNSPGGIVNLVSKRPTDQPIHDLGVQIGSNNDYEGTFDFGGPLDADGKFLYRLNGIGRTDDTQFDFNRQRRLAISPAFEWRPNEDTSLTLLTNYQRDDPGGRFYNLVPANGSVLDNPHGKIPSDFTDADPDYDDFTRTQYAVGYQFEHRFNDTFTARQNFRYMHVDGTYRDIFSAGLAPDMETLTRFTRYNVESLDAFTVDNQGQAKLTTGPVSQTFLAGVDYRRTTDENKVGLGLAPSLDLFDPSYGGIDVDDPPFYTNTFQTIDQMGFYLQDQVKWNRLSLLFSGREDLARSNIRSRLANQTTSQSDTKFTWRAGAVYLFDFGLAPYVSYSTSFYPTAGTDFAGAPFKPTTGEQYEAGIKYQPTGFDSFVTVSAYQLTQKNVLTADPDPTHLGFNVQTGAVRSRGIEVEGHASLSQNIDLVLSYTYLDDVVTKSTTGNKGKVPLYMPKHSASLWTNYKFSEGTVFSGVELGGGFRYVGTTYGDTANTFKVPDYAIFDARAEYNLGALSPKLDGVSLALNVSNLLDKKYVAGCGGTFACYYGDRRTFIGSIHYAW